MAFDAYSLRMVSQHIKGAFILCLGYPDILLSSNDIGLVLPGVRPTRFTDHGRNHKAAFPLPETLHVLELAGASQVDVIDVNRTRGCEQVMDLNYPIVWDKSYDLVINPGTLEHCFNIGQAFFNAWSALREGGRMLHVAPVSMVNHGYYNLCPVVIRDFVEMNGGKVIATQAVDKKKSAVEVVFDKRHIVPPETVMYVLTQKVEQVDPTMPTQGCYR